MVGVRRSIAATVAAGAVFVGGGLASLIAPETSAASCAGCAQYTNPLGSTTHSATQSATQTTPPVTQAPTTPPSTTPAETGTVEPSQTLTGTDPQLSATAAAGVAAGSSTTSGPSLPRTGYDSWTILGFGVVLVGGGVFVRRRIRRT